MVMNELFDLIVKILGPTAHRRSIQTTKVDEKPEPTLETTDLIFRPAFLPAKVWNSELVNEFVVVVPH